MSTSNSGYTPCSCPSWWRRCFHPSCAGGTLAQHNGEPRPEVHAGEKRKRQADGDEEEDGETEATPLLTGFGGPVLKAGGATFVSLAANAFSPSKPAFLPAQLQPINVFGGAREEKEDESGDEGGCEDAENGEEWNDAQDIDAVAGYEANNPGYEDEEQDTTETTQAPTTNTIASTRRRRHTPPASRVNDDAAPTCFFWYHNNNCSRTSKRDRCPFEHRVLTLEDVMPPSRYVHRERCFLPLCPHRTTVEGSNGKIGGVRATKRQRREDEVVAMEVRKAMEWHFERVREGEEMARRKDEEEEEHNLPLQGGVDTRSESRYSSSINGDDEEPHRTHHNPDSSHNHSDHNTHFFPSFSGSETCFFWYHHGTCNRMQRPNGCNFRHQLPASLSSTDLAPPPGYVHFEACYLPLCPVKTPILADQKDDEVVKSMVQEAMAVHLNRAEESGMDLTEMDRKANMRRDVSFDTAMDILGGYTHPENETQAQVQTQTGIQAPIQTQALVQTHSDPTRIAKRQRWGERRQLRRAQQDWRKGNFSTGSGASNGNRHRFDLQNPLISLHGRGANSVSLSPVPDPPSWTQAQTARFNNADTGVELSEEEGELFSDEEPPKPDEEEEWFLSGFLDGDEEQADIKGKGRLLAAGDTVTVYPRAQSGEKQL
ncbi:hypothetical protein K402DRAFT_416981 [Aulographum hederae CBS 113979]|uniref:C3H1-type domain-containing protein n=1 Tax=Aulographum hederae CBS 113979 TaxID=1176131 RepID=A0A6G1HFJ9_9PEZI|nr:hypothetical protein K402DRAFT_416981 [Aulographum hederae CBS 113979]